ncbi:MAG TPA: hypothetical protein VLA19_18195 [Herpetosiphonaceae bacterium]|nr:hypothetical protein [Herpetosiphonaceae bacterium]
MPRDHARDSLRGEQANFLAAPVFGAGVIFASGAFLLLEAS